MQRLKPYLVFCFFLALSGCFTQKESSPPALSSGSVERGKAVYQNYCTACHNIDPHKAGSIGPDVFGSSRELLEARILRGEYPAGYQPKRTTHSMAPLPQLKNDIESIHLYLNQKN